MTESNAHDPGPEVARERADAAGQAGRLPIRIGSGVVRCGTASWTDPTMTAPGVFYPEDAKSAEERLRYYSSQFPVVEVDATYYALPYKRMAEAWVERTPKHFVFDIKAHALMTGQPTEVARLPKAISEQLPAELKEKKRIYRKDLPEEILNAVYEQFREALEPLNKAGKLGAVFVQFPKWVFPSNEARDLILETRRRLNLPIAVEFRHGSWFNEKNAERTVAFLKSNQIPYVAVDEPQGFKSSVPPVAVQTSSDLAVFRFHGRNEESWEKKGIEPSERFRYSTTRTSLPTGGNRSLPPSRAQKKPTSSTTTASATTGPQTRVRWRAFWRSSRTKVVDLAKASLARASLPWRLRDGPGMRRPMTTCQGHQNARSAGLRPR